MGLFCIIVTMLFLMKLKSAITFKINTVYLTFCVC